MDTVKNCAPTEIYWSSGMTIKPQAEDTKYSGYPGIRMLFLMDPGKLVNALHAPSCGYIERENNLVQAADNS